MRRTGRAATAFVALALAGAVRAATAKPVHAQEAPIPAGQTARAPVPFDVGEKLEYDVKFGPIHVGSGSMEIANLDTIRGRTAYHTVFRVSGGTFFYKVRDRLESWIDVQTLASLRSLQDLNEGSRDRERHFEIYPERGVFVEDQKPEQPTVAAPLDDGSFLYFLRTIPLEVGQEYSFDRYFRPDRNPVRIRVLRKEHIKVPAGEFDAVVVQPIIKSKGIFSENGRAEVWLSDDDRRIMLQMKSKLSIGSLNLYLKSYQPPPAAGQATSR